jgi:UDP-glucose 4-epimerase
MLAAEPVRISASLSGGTILCAYPQKEATTISSNHMCLIGGAGFLGTALRRHLCQDGGEPVVVGRSQSVQLEVQERYFAATDGSLQSYLAEHGTSTIVDFAYATVPSTSFEDPVADFSLNLGAVLRHLQLSLDVGANSYVFISSGGTVYGDPGCDPIPETAPNSPVSPYGITKLACEHYVLLFNKIHALPAIIVRPSNVYGPGQIPFRGQGLIATAFAAALRGVSLRIYGDGSQVRDYLYVDDFCAGLTDAMNAGEAGQVYNLGSGTGTSVRELLEQIAEIVVHDGCALDVDWREERPFDVHCNILDTRKLRSLNEWVPKVPLERGLKATWEWIKRQ